jgi:hypothetical protein
MRGDSRRPFPGFVACYSAASSSVSPSCRMSSSARSASSYACRDFLLHLARSLFHFRREPHVAVILHAGAGGNQTAHDDVLLQTAQVIDRSLDGSFGQHARCLLERRGRDERVGGERRLRDTEQQRTARWPACRPCAIARSFSSRKRNLSTCCSSRNGYRPRLPPSPSASSGGRSLRCACPRCSRPASR